MKIIIGYINSYDKICCRLCDRFSVTATHSHQFPLQTHKLFRFLINEWQLDDSVFSKDNLSQNEKEDVVAFIEKNYSHLKL
jgi:hypothetical protein